MNMMPGLPKLPAQICEFLFAVSKDFQLVSNGKNRTGIFQIIKNQVSEISENRIIFLHLVIFPDDLLLAPYRITQPVFNLFYPEHPALPVILSEQQVKQNTENRNEIQRQQPCPDAFRVS